MSAIDIVVVGLSFAWLVFVLNIAVHTIIDVIKEMKE